MGIDKSAGAYQGLLIPDERITWDAFDEANSVNTQAGPRPLAPRPDQVSALSLAASGESDGTPYDLRVQVGGCPGRDDATSLWRPSGAGGQQWRGWDPPIHLSGWKAIDPDTTANAYLSRSALRLASGIVLCASHNRDTIVRVTTVATSGLVSSVTDVYDRGTAYADGPHPCMVQLPSGRVLLFFLTEVGDTSQLRMYYSDDDGASWTMGQRACFKTAIDRLAYTIQRMSVARVGGELVLMLSVSDLTATLTWPDVLVQYASQDLGASWTLIDTWAGSTFASSGAVAVVEAIDDAFVLAYLRAVDETSADAIPCIRRIGSAWDPFGAAEDIEVQVGSTTGPVWGDVSGTAFTSSTHSAQGLTLAVDDDGTAYILGRDTATDYQGVILVSFDGGLTWSGIGQSAAPTGYATWWQADGAVGHPKRLAAAMQGGRLLVFLSMVASTYNDESLFCAQLGGYTDVEMPRAAAGDAPNHRVTWGVVYWPSALPEAVGATWTTGHVGAPTTDIVDGTLDVVQLAGEAAVWTAAPFGAIDNGVLFESDVWVETGSARMQVEVSDGTYGHGVRVTVTATQLVVRDVARGADLATVSLTSDEQFGVAVRVALCNPTGVGSSNDGYCKVWKRPAGLHADRDWDVVLSSTGWYSGSYLANSVRIGGATGAAHMQYGPSRFSASEEEIGLGVVGQDNPDDLQGRALGAVPVEITGGLRIHGEGGPGFRGDTWRMKPAYDHGAELIHHEVSRSPARRWRSVDNSNDEDFRWTLGDEVELPQGTSLAIYLGGLNWRVAALYGLTGGGAYQKICDISTVKASTLSFARFGNTVRPDVATGNNGGWLEENGCAGWTWRQLAGGVTPVFRRIVSNTAGTWAPGTHQLARLHLTGAVAGDDASGTSGELWSNQVLVIVQDPSEYKGYKLTIPAQDTADGYREVGICLPGHIHAFGQLPSWSRQLGWESTAEIDTKRTGARKVRSPAPVRRRASFSWDEPVDTTELFASSVDPSWTTGFGAGQGHATPADAVLGMGGLFSRLQGAKTPVVYVPRIPRVPNGASDITLVDPWRMLYGAITSTEFLADQSLGNECDDEMLRGGRVTIQEEV